MEQAFLVARQVFLIYIYIAIGFICARKGAVDESAGKSLSNISLMVTIPALLVRTFIRPYEANGLSALGLAFLLATVFHIIATAASACLIKKRTDVRYRIERLGAIFSNCGYMAVPLINAALGEDGVFYAIAFICVFNISIWPLGTAILTGEVKISFRKIFVTPGVLGTAAGLALYLGRLTPPAIIVDALDRLVALNTPLPMITTGIFLSKINFRETLTDKKLYYTSFIRLIAMPAAMTAIIKLARVSLWLPEAGDVVMVIILGCACPAAALTTQFPARLGLDSEYGAKIIAVSTLLSIVTLPAVTLLVNMLI